MFRLVSSTCGVLVEFATIDSSVSFWGTGLAGGTLLLATIVWWAELRPLVDHLVGAEE